MRSPLPEAQLQVQDRGLLHASRDVLQGLGFRGFGFGVPKPYEPLSPLGPPGPHKPCKVSSWGYSRPVWCGFRV